MVGRFLWNFAIVEGYISEIIVTLFDLSAFSSLILLKKLSFRDKIRLAQLGLKRQGIESADLDAALKELHKLHDVRNAIAHTAFGEEEDGVEFDYVNDSGRLVLPLRRDKPDEAAYWDTRITFEQFDDWHERMIWMWKVLGEAHGSCRPLRDDEETLTGDIREIVDNVIPFPRRKKEDD